MQVTDDEIAKAIHECRGIKSSICKRIGISLTVLNKRIKASEDLTKVLAESEEQMKDFAESKLFKAIKAGQAWAVRLYLTTKAKDRGYTTKLEVDANVEQTGRVEIYLPDNGRDPVGITSGDGESNDQD